MRWPFGQELPVTTKGFIVFIAGGEDKNSYNHLDSGPHELGVKLLHWLRGKSRQPDILRPAITRLRAVSDEDGPPPAPEEVSRLQAYSDPAAGDPAGEWSALLRRTQGDPDAILASGYIVHEEDTFGWIYEINAYEQAFSVWFDSGTRTWADHSDRPTWPWSALPADQRFLAEAEPLGQPGIRPAVSRRQAAGQPPPESAAGKDMTDGHPAVPGTRPPAAGSRQPFARPDPKS